jgi:hypothetical protein
MTKWHKTTGTYRSLFFTDPQNLSTGLAASFTKKCDILIQNLLVKTAKAGDILFGSSSVALRKIDFLLVRAIDILAQSHPYGRKCRPWP